MINSQRCGACALAINIEIQRLLPPNLVSHHIETLRLNSVEYAEFEHTPVNISCYKVSKQVAVCLK